MGGSDSLNSDTATSKQPEQKKDNLALYVGLLIVAIIFLPRMIGTIMELHSLHMKREVAQEVRQYQQSPDCTIYTGKKRDECYFTHALDAALRKKIDTGDCSKITSQVLKKECEKYVQKFINQTSLRFS